MNFDPCTPADDQPLHPRVARSRARVLEAATELLAEHGPRAVTVDAVTEHSGVAKSTIYRHWPSQTALLVDVFRNNVPPLPEVDPALDFEGALREHVAGLLEAFSDPHWRNIMPALFLLKRQIEELDEITAMDVEERASAFHEVMALGVAEGRIPADLDPHLPMTAIVGPLMFAVLGGHIDEQRVADYVVEELLAAYPPPT
ncbi:MAG: TetR/AcrR family transcriptional regulator [Actinomycetota bacterium]|nr:TetR/AcrR family transcriptional regulator [Actinomycetota bacterium]